MIITVFTIFYTNYICYYIKTIHLKYKYCTLFTIFAFTEFDILLAIKIIYEALDVLVIYIVQMFKKVSQFS